MALKWNTNSSCMLFSHGFPIFCLIDILFKLSQAWHWLRNSSIERAFSVCAWTPPPLHRVFTTFSHFMSKVVKSRTSKTNVKSHLFNAKRKVRSSDFQTSKAAHCFFLCLCSIFQNTIETSLKACLFFQSLYQHCSRNIEPDMDVLNLYMFVLYLQAYNENQRKTSLFAYALAHYFMVLKYQSRFILKLFQLTSN